MKHDKFDGLSARLKKRVKRLAVRWRGSEFFLLRRVAAVGFLLAAAITTISAPANSAQDIAQENASPREAIVVSARDLPSGVSLTPGDLRIVLMPVNLRPKGSFTSIEPLLNQVLIGAARSGEPITDKRLSSSITGLPDPGKPAAGTPGLAIVAIRLTDPGISALLRTGAHIDVVSTDSVHGEIHTLAKNAIVVTIASPKEKTPTSGGVFTNPSGNSSENPLVLIAVPLDISAQVAAASMEKSVTVTLR